MQEVCWFGTCVPRCASSADCQTPGILAALVPLATCVMSDDGDLGRCAPTAQVLAVQSDAPCDVGDGTQPHPYCTLDQALGSFRQSAKDRQKTLASATTSTGVPAPLRVVRLLPSGLPYDGQNINDLATPLGAYQTAP